MTTRAQAVQREARSAEDVTTRPRPKLQDAFRQMIHAADTLGTDWRTAAMTVGVGRLAEASRMRAVYP